MLVLELAMRNKCSAKGDSFTATFTTSTADVESAVRAVIERKKVCPLCKKEHGPQEKCEVIKKWRKRGIAPNDRSDHSRRES